MTDIEIELHIPPQPGKPESSTPQIIPFDTPTRIKGFDWLLITHSEGEAGMVTVTEMEDYRHPDPKRHLPAELPPNSHLRVMSNRSDHAFLDIRHLPLTNSTKSQP